MKILHLPQGSIKVLNDHPALDLLNSVDVIRGERLDALDSDAGFAHWSVVANLIEPKQASALRKGQMEQIREQAVAIRRLLRAELTTPGNTSAELAATLNGLLPKTLLNASRSGVRLNVASKNAGDLLLANVALQVADLLLCVPRHRVRQCMSPDCDWFFIDHSGGRRQWCLMSGCGNAAKARRHRARNRNAV